MNKKDIINLVDEIYLSDTAQNKIIDKDKSDEFKFWKSITKGEKVLGKEFYNDTTGQNLAFTYFQLFSEKYDSIKIQDLLYVQKSFIGNFVTFYIKTNIVRESEGLSINYNKTLLCEPIGKFKKYFEANWNYLNQFYSNLTYIPFHTLEHIPKNSTNYKIKNNSNLYELIFGYEGNILKSNIIGDKHYSVKTSGHK